MRGWPRLTTMSSAPSSTARAWRPCPPSTLGLAHACWVGVGTGLTLRHYRNDKVITGIDLSSEMLRKARDRARLRNVEALLEMDAQATSFSDGRFDIAAMMFVASVVPNPRALMVELRRIVKPGGRIVIVNHFAAEHGLKGRIERTITPDCKKIGWRADFRLGDLLPPTDAPAPSADRCRPSAFSICSTFQTECTAYRHIKAVE
jgi:phosphatidylethanolamine/phosphatidyl-N-methylethanolamine N-methyltransferase